MSEMKCPFCGEPRVRKANEYDVFRCGTIGPDPIGEYDTGRACNIHVYHKLIREKDAEIERLKKLLSDILDDTEYSNKTIIERWAPLRERWGELK